MVRRPQTPSSSLPSIGQSTWKQEVRDPLRETVPQRFTEQGQMVVGNGVDELKLLNAPVHESVLVYANGEPIWDTGNALIPDGNITREQLETDAQLPVIDSTKAGQFVAAVRISRNPFVYGYVLDTEIPQWSR